MSKNFLLALFLFNFLAFSLCITASESEISSQDTQDLIKFFKSVSHDLKNSDVDSNARFLLSGAFIIDFY